MDKHFVPDLQHLFVERCIEKQAHVTVFLVNGVKLQGVITAQGHYGILLSREDHNQFVYHHACSTIHPSAPLELGVLS